ncbi:MAG: siderophore ABC transporter substrate-binding protein [Paracoccus sp. (in: a-proteobacteria)]|nr:siderophore ABC transporter substrate-binding protein [Paracoccus sp. (in: a-proteobacteria)]
MTCFTPVFTRAASMAAIVIGMALPVMAQDMVLTHPQGQTVLAETPAQVFVTDWAAFDNLTALGVPVAGLPDSNIPGYLADQLPEDALRIGSLMEPDFEAIANARPDLVIIAARSRTAYPTMSQIAPTYDATVDNAALIDEVKARLTTYGEVFGVQDRAAELIGNLDAKLAEARAAAEGRGTGLVIVTNAGKIGIYGPASRVAWIYDELGVPSVFDSVDDRDHGGDAISFEYLAEQNPDWLFVVDRDAGTGSGQGEAARALLDNELIHDTTFWSKGQMIFLDPTAAYVTMHGYQGIMLLLDQVIAGYQAR